MNEAIVTAVIGLIKDEVELEFIEALDNNETDTGVSRNFIWSDSGDHSEDLFGTVGSIKFINLKSTRLIKHLAPNGNALSLGIKLKSMNAEVQQVRSGHMVKGDFWSIGLNDELGINLLGNPTPNDSFGEHGALTVNTQWRWDNNETQWSFDIFYSLLGAHIREQESIGTPDDWSFP